MWQCYVHVNDSHQLLQAVTIAVILHILDFFVQILDHASGDVMFL